jgi:hypothetical protein
MEETLKDVIDFYVSHENYDIQNVYMFGSALRKKSADSVSPNDIDLVMLVPSLRGKHLYRADYDYLKNRGWLPHTYASSVPFSKDVRMKGVEGIVARICKIHN